MHPTPAIYPADAKARGKAIWYEEFADTILTPAGGKVVFNRFVGPKLLGLPGDEAAAELGVAEVGKIADWFETVVPAQGWLVGAEFGIADIAVASVFGTLNYVGLAPDAARHPATAAWFERVKARSAWQAVAANEAAALAARG